MSESTCLHIQDRESGPIRVVELPWISVRIGRAAYCEVCLPDEKLGDEACRLTRRGRIWSLVPGPGQQLILFEGRPLTGPCPVPFDVPFRIGPYCLTLRHDVAAEPDWEMYPASAPSGQLEASGTSDVGPEWTADLEPAANLPGAAPNPPEEAAAKRGDPDRWRARWKAAEAHFKTRNTRIGADDQRGSYPSQTGVPRDSARPVSRPASMDAPPTETRPRPAPSPVAPRFEPTWSVPRPEPTMTAPAHRARPCGPTPASAVLRPDPIETVVPEVPSAAPVPASDATSADLQPPLVAARDDRLELLDRDLVSALADELSEVQSPTSSSSVPASTAVEVESSQPFRSDGSSEEPRPTRRRGLGRAPGRRDLDRARARSRREAVPQWTTRGETEDPAPIGRSRRRTRAARVVTPGTAPDSPPGD